MTAHISAKTAKMYSILATGVLLSLLPPTEVHSIGLPTISFGVENADSPQQVPSVMARWPPERDGKTRAVLGEPKSSLFLTQKIRDYLDVDAQVVRDSARVELLF